MIKSKIIKLLKASNGTYISGEEISSQLGVSRQAVWKNIKVLENEGYAIASIPGKGYRLIRITEKLFAPEIESRIKNSSFKWSIECYDELVSTNLFAIEKIHQGNRKEGLVVVADRQTGGLGRRGRVWESPAGNSVYMSFVLTPDISPLNVSCITLITALAVREVLQNYSEKKVCIKWPNDIIIDGKKICGILTQMSCEPDYVSYVVPGIGINVNNEEFDECIKNTATSLYAETGVMTDRCVIIAEVLEHFEKYYAEFLKSCNMSPFIDIYNEVLADKDEKVYVYKGLIEDTLPENVITGVARGIDDQGALMVEVDGQIIKVVSGEVSVRGVYGYV